jgi:hypothetical protein
VVPATKGQRLVLQMDRWPHSIRQAPRRWSDENPMFRIWNRRTKQWQERDFHLIGEVMLLQGFPIKELNAGVVPHICAPTPIEVGTGRGGVAGALAGVNDGLLASS